jgi:pyruvate dehydrogenase E2 component (dihydrolipoamide acetyltransferase)
MAEKVLMIALSPTMDEGTIVSWQKKEGEPVAPGQVICVVETDKAAMDYEIQSEGTLLKILVPAGGQAKVADPIAILGSPGEDFSSLLSPEPRKEPVPARTSAASPAPAAIPAAARALAPVAARPAGERVRSSPLARTLAAARGLDLAAISGSGPEGRVVRRDVEAAATPPGGTNGAAASTGLSDQTMPVTGKRKVIAQRLTEAVTNLPHFFLTVSVEMDGLLAARTRLNQGRARKVSLNAFLHKLTAEALRRHPVVNSSWQGDTIRRFGSVDLGLAVALADGLITPVVRSCQTKGILEIDDELTGLVQKARDGKLAPPEYTGATFTISNLGSLGIDEFTAVINPPGAAILALGKIQKTPVVDTEGTIVVRSLMRATLTCDHRVIDGAVGAAFLRDLKDIVENPYAALY